MRSSALNVESQDTRKINVLGSTKRCTLVTRKEKSDGHMGQLK